MRKLIIFHYIKEDYTVSHSVMLNFRLFYYKKDYFKSKGYEITTVKDYIKESDLIKINNKEENYKFNDNDIKKIQDDACVNFINIIKNDNTYNNSIIIGVHPIGFMWMYANETYDILKKKNIKLINWQDDLHVYPRNIKADITTNVNATSLDRMDLMLTPSIHYWKNINSPYLSKTNFYFYCINETFNNMLRINNFKTRKNKILLSGAIYNGYDVRQELLRYYNKFHNNTATLASYIDYFEHPTYDRNKNKGKTGLDYYKVLNSYKGAFFGFYKYPLDYPLAKIIEILFCGTLGFFEYSPVLKDYLGLIEYVHYVPLLKDTKGTLILDKCYFLKYLDTIEGEKIALAGCNYVRSKFNMTEKCNELIKILSPL